MNPIPTTNAMKPAPGKGVSSFPTPVIKDTVIVEVVNAWAGGYQPLEYGTEWDSISHASVQGSYPDHKLVSQAPNSEDGQWVKRIWANDRVDQDTYNYAIKYSGGSDQHPIYIRTYILPREGYAPVPDLSPDPFFPGAVLVDEEVDRESSELDSRYLKVTRVYETLPGPIIPTKRINERGDLETVNTQTVPPNTEPAPDGLLVTQSQVVQEEVSKGVKTTATVEQHSVLFGSEKKSGLLANTVITDSIVNPSTQPDSLTFTESGGVLESSISSISATKSKKTTVTSSGPISLSTETLVDSPIGMVKATVEKSIVDPLVEPSNGVLVLKDSINKTDEVKSEREKVIVYEEWPKVYGAWADAQNGILLPYYETIVDRDSILWSGILDYYKEYEPIDETKVKIRAYDPDTVKKILEDKGWTDASQSMEVDVTLPDKLLDVTAYFGLDFAQGNGDSEGTGAGTSYSYNYSGSFTSSSSATGDIYFKIQKGYKGPVPGFKYVFYTNNQNMSQESLLEELNDRFRAGFSLKIKPYPRIKMISENLVIIGGSKAKTESKSESASISLNGSSNSYSNNTSFNVSVSANSVVVPETLHPQRAINVSTIGSLGELPVEFHVLPETLPPTEPTSFPAGIYLMAANFERYKFDYYKVTCVAANVLSEYTQ